jgi:hypothetical protein
MPRKKHDGVNRLVVPANSALKQIHAKYRQQFIAADLQQYTEMDKGVPIQRVIAKMEVLQRRLTPGRKKS